MTTYEKLVIISLLEKRYIEFYDIVELFLEIYFGIRSEGGALQTILNQKLKVQFADHFIF